MKKLVCVIKPQEAITEIAKEKIMSKYPLDRSVLSKSIPSLDESSSNPYQFDAYKEALTKLFDAWENDTPVITSVAAGAGSGKTRLMTAILNGIEKSGVEPGLIEAISFTNASCDDFQKKYIKSQIEDSTSQNNASLVNISFSTIHQNAANTLKKLEPHLGGVGYYFEDSKSGSLEEDEDEERKRAMRLALYSSVVYGRESEDLLSKLTSYVDGKEKIFILEDLGGDHHYEHAEKFIREDMVSDAGLGAFTNMGEGGPDFCIAVATDALMRLYNSNIEVDVKRRVYGMPAFVLLDEAQDLDLIQLLYIRALALNGASVVMVGDSRQTLYEFRQSISDLPFNEEFLKDLVDGTNIEASVSIHTLNTNYRSRKEIIDSAEEISDLLIEYSEKRTNSDIPSNYIERINDHAIARGEAFICQENRADKEKPAVTVIIGEAVSDSKIPVEKSNNDSENSDGAMALLNQALSNRSDKPKKPVKKRKKNTQLLALSGGENEIEITERICALHERVKNGETASIITRQGIRDNDVNFLKNLISSKYPADEPHFNLISPPKHTALSEYWILDGNKSVKKALPFSSIMISGAIAFFFSSDKETRERLQIEGLREVNQIFSGPRNVIHNNNDRHQIEKSISEELNLYFDAIASKLKDVFPGLEDGNEIALISQWSNLKNITARFVCDVLFRYARICWEKSEIVQPVPCRFHHVACQYIDGKYSGMAVRPIKQTKNYLKNFWRAVAMTPFGVTKEEREFIISAGLEDEYMDANTSLLNFTESLINFFAIFGHKHEDVNYSKSTLLNDRETIYEELSRIFHLKTRSYMRHIARGIGKHIRNNPHATEEGIYQVVWDEHYFSAKYDARMSITHKPNKNQYGGLFLDLLNGMKNEATLRRKHSSVSSINHSIDLTTIHSSKGLEWDHVILYFPQPNPNDKDSSFKSFRDLIYVAMTRAAKTLTIIIQKPKKFTESPSDTGMKVINKLMHEWAEGKCYYSRMIDYGDIEEQVTEETDMEVFEETSHSELERAQTCRLDHYTQNMRTLSTMISITAPSYAFFFHSSMSTICAAFIGQRVPSKNDPSKDIANTVRRIIDLNLKEHEAFKLLQDYADKSLYMLMESMIPMYFLSERDHHNQLMTYYVDSFSHHLASIAANARLFRVLEQYKDNADHQILIEKSIRNVFNEENAFLPTYGIPDIKIQGPEITYVCDYKTVPQDDDGSGEDYARKVSEKTERQINYYQGMITTSADQNYLTELVYVADITVFDTEEIPDTCEAIPYIQNGPNFNVVANAEHARIFWTDQLDIEQFESTKKDIHQLRKKYQHASVLPTDDLFQASPLVGDVYMEVSSEQCRLCASQVHCQKDKTELDEQGVF